MKNLLLICTFLCLNSLYAQTKINNIKAKNDLANNKEIQLLDVRTTKEFNEKHIADAIHIDWKDQAKFESSLTQLDKTRPVYIYCLGGGRSAQAAQKLKELGYEVYDIEGGVMKWEAADLPLIHGTQIKEPKEALSLAEFNAFIKNNDQVLIDFYAVWCAPCQELMPIVDKISEKYKGTLKVLKIDVDKNKELVKALGISSIPTLFLYKNNVKTWSTSTIATQKHIEKQIHKK